MSGFSRRIDRLLSEVQSNRPPMTTFKVEDGSLFYTELDPMTYLLKYGAKTERGRIVGYEPPPGAHDPITGAVYAEIRRQVLGEILAHPVPDRNIHDYE